MAEQHVRDLIIDKLSEEIGVLAGVIVDDVLADLDIDQDSLKDKLLATKFLARLKKELPDDLDVPVIIEEIRVAIYLKDAVR